MALPTEPCPFCGSQHLIIRNNLNSWAIVCQSCKANGPHRPSTELALLEWNRTARHMQRVKIPTKTSTDQAEEQLGKLNSAINNLGTLLSHHPGKSESAITE